jgi:hypothetical protein
MKKVNEEYPIRIVLRDWSKARKANTVAEKTERIPSLSVLPTKQTEIKCASKKLN